MRRIFVTCLFVVAFNAYAENPDINCLRKEYLKYTQETGQYWKTKDTEFNKRYPDLYKDFSYLIKEQMNHNRMQEISVDYIARHHLDEFKMDGSLYNMVPRYKHYQQAIYRELRTIPEFNQLFLENESFKKEIKMPDYSKLKRASEIVWKELDAIPAVIEVRDSALKLANKMVSRLPCNTHTK